MFKPTSVSYDAKGVQFVASMEAIDYPFYGLQFHPEKEQFSFYPDGHFTHTEQAIVYNRYFADFFVSETKQNSNKFSSYAKEMSSIVENFDVFVTTGYDGNVYAF